MLKMTCKSLWVLLFVEGGIFHKFLNQTSTLGENPPGILNVNWLILNNPEGFLERGYIVIFFDNLLENKLKK